ncbi:MAG: glycosyltransferase [Burkholderiaceae bacterium]|nr:glycosyltransferase [Burkholderiaceae bacterium]
MKRYVLLGDGESPHLLKWARALADRVELHALSTRGFAPGFDAVVPEARRLALHTNPAFEGGNVSVLRVLPRLGRWLRAVDADWIHAHYLTSHGVLAWLAKGLYRLRARLIGSAWGSDILVTPARSAMLRWMTARVLRACALGTSDSEHMAKRMRELGAREVMVFPFGLDALPPDCREAKQARLCFASRGLEALYAPRRVLDVFAAIASVWPDAELVVANDGSLRAELERTAASAAWGQRARFVGRLGAVEQVQWYRRANWYLSLPASDSVSVSVLEAMAHGCVPVLSDLPANRELVTDGVNGVIAHGDATAVAAAIQAIAPRAGQIAQANRLWIAEHAIFPQAIGRFLDRLSELESAR